MSGVLQFIWHYIGCYFCVPPFRYVLRQQDILIDSRIGLPFIAFIAAEIRRIFSSKHSLRWNTKTNSAFSRPIISLIIIYVGRRQYLKFNVRWIEMQEKLPLHFNFLQLFLQW